MKFREFVNLIDDKIDYLFRRGKNADESCSDYCIRTVTFFVVVLIVLCYASFAYADITIISLGDTENYSEVFNSDNLNTWLSEQNLATTDFTTVGIVSGLSSYPFTVSDLPNLAIPESIVFNDKTYIPEDYYIFLCRGNVSDHGISYLTCYVIVGENLIIGNGGTTIFNFENSGIGVWAAAINPNNLSNIWDGNPTYSQTTQGIGSATNGFDSSITYQYFSPATPVYYCNAPIYTLKVDESIDANVRSDFAYQYKNYPDNVFMINYLYALANPEEPEVPETESNANHMYLKYINASFYGSNNLADSNFIVSARWDDWIEQHINDYECDIYYEIYYDGEPWKREVDGELVGEAIYGEYMDTVPLGVLSGGYTTEFRTIANKMQINNQSLNAMIENLQKSNMIIGTPNPVMDVGQALNGGSSEFKISLSEVNIGALYAFFQRLDDLTNQHAGETVVYVGSFHFDVTINIHDKNNRDIESGDFSRRWDFVQGSSSTLYDIYNNGNPWEGSTSEGTAISGQSGGSSINNSNIAYGGQGGNSSSIGNSNTVNVYGNGYQDTELHQLTKEDIEENHINIIRTIESLRDVFERFAEVKNDRQSFLQMIFTEFYEIPGVAYMVLSLIVVFSVMVFIFIIKIAF